MHSNVPRTLTRSTRSNSSAGMSSNGPGVSAAKTAALATSPSTGPSRVSICVTIDANAPPSVMSQTPAQASPPSVRIASATGPQSSTSQSATRAPAAATARA